MATRFIDTADLVAITTINGEQHVLLVERNWPPYEAHLALPGGLENWRTCRWRSTTATSCPTRHSPSGSPTHWW